MKKIIRTSIIALVLLIACGLLLINTMAGPKTAVPIAQEYQKNSQAAHQPDDQTVFSVLSLNLAHGRQMASHQVLLTTPEIRTNLDAIITVLRREKADFVAVQEADAPSMWSGRFSHVDYIARHAGYNHSVQGIHVQGLGLSYGTAVLSQMPLTNPKSMTFKASPPTLTKGFTVATVTVNGSVEIDLVSVHLDFFSKRVRQSQIQTMVQELSQRDKPLILMGDFNNEWQEGSAPQLLSHELGLTTYQPDNSDLVTFPALQKRIDYILISPEFEFISYTTLSAVLSDHSALRAILRLKAQ